MRRIYNPGQGNGAGETGIEPLRPPDYKSDALPTELRQLDVG